MRRSRGSFIQTARPRRYCLLFSPVAHDFVGNVFGIVLRGRGPHCRSRNCCDSDKTYRTFLFMQYTYLYIYILFALYFCFVRIFFAFSFENFNRLNLFCIFARNQSLQYLYYVVRDFFEFFDFLEWLPPQLHNMLQYYETKDFFFLQISILKFLMLVAL